MYSSFQTIASHETAIEHDAPAFSFYDRLYSRGFPDGDRFYSFFSGLWETWAPVAYMISIVLLVALVYILVRLRQIRSEQQKYLRKLTLDAQGSAENVVNEKWSRILQLAASTNENDWRQAIIEADVILDNMMTAMGYTQQTLGEKLKTVEKSDFTSIDKAWEAHKMRNKVAHEGSEASLSHREVRRVIELYKEVFQEFHYI